ncbi:BUD13 homolog [Drosophila novamexicana]|uniref:BUD13 homolog n=1 Tax=Drosophila novamexicana TaxID=47314 RepID=UPI0011E5CE5B|nr:BUD13 homolog [Drosophila novamexicana]
MSMQNAKLINQKEYLKKYLSGDKEKKKKKKEKKHKKSIQAKVKIIDDDAYDANTEEMDEDLLLGGEDAPQIVGEYIEENPDAIRSKWRNIAVKDEPKTEVEENGDAVHIKQEPADGDTELWGRKASAIKIKHEQSPSNIGAPAIKIKLEKRSSSREQSPAHNLKRRTSDQSPPRRRLDANQSPHGKRRDSDQSPPRRRPNTSQSPPRRRKDTDQSPPRRSRDADQSPPRRKRDTDQSPPRRRPNKDQSPPTRRRDADQSPPGRGRVVDESQPRRGRDGNQSSDVKRSKVNGSDQSPPRRCRDVDQSPPRKRQNSDQSPPRRRREADHSPLRRRRSSDQSPPRRRQSPPKKRRDSDQSPPRRCRSSSRDRRRATPTRIKKEERKSRWAKVEPSRTPSPPPTHKPKGQAQMRTLDGKKAGLQDAQSLKTETDERRREERRMFDQMSSEVSGRDAEVQMRSTGRRGRRARDAAAEDPAEQQRKEAHEQQKKQLYERWGKGLKQLEDQRARHEEMAHEAAKPVARYANDEDLDRHLREQEHADDPMLEYMRQKRKKRDQLSDKPVLPVYEGSYPENRYGIRPGYRWDGVDRSNGYEQRWFDKQNERRAAQDEAYKYSVEDM